MSGPGAVGKDTLIDMLRRRDRRLTYSISYTTRPRRAYEAEGELLEHARVNGYLYGTSVSRVEEALRRGHDVILKIDVQGAEQIRERRPDALFIFVSPPSMDELLRRRERRASEAREEMEARQRLAEVEMAYAPRYDHVVVNDDAERAVAEIQAILEDARRRGRSELARAR
jgi:guanylate kinase